MPEGSLSHGTDPEESAWGVTEELLAQLIEEVSVLASDRRRKEPRSIPRPGVVVETSQEGLSGTPSTGIQARGLGGMLAATEALGGARRNE